MSAKTSRLYSVLANRHYHGNAFGWMFLLLMGAMNLFRASMPWLAGFHLLQQVGAALVVWWRRPLPLPAPGKYGAVAILPVVSLAFFAATRRSDAPTPLPAPVASSAG
jgi:hypothetical protein